MENLKESEPTKDPKHIRVSGRHQSLIHKNHPNICAGVQATGDH